MFYINNSDISKIFDDTPEAITAWICSHLGVPFGSAAPTGIKVYLPWLGKKAYEAIMAAYTTASRQNGKKYIPLMQNVNQVCVIEKGTLCGVVLDGGYNLTEATYKTSLQKLVDRVIVTDKNGNQTSVVEDAGAQSKYGVVQRVYKQRGGQGHRLRGQGAAAHHGPIRNCHRHQRHPRRLRLCHRRPGGYHGALWEVLH